MPSTRSDDRYAASRALLEQAKTSLPGGVTSPFRAKAPVPLFLAEADGSHIVDADGNRYIDYTLAWGPLILGHRHPSLVDVVTRQASRPHIYGAQHELEHEAAEAVKHAVPCAERVAFTCSGTEAVQLALRLARAYTGRNLVLKFEGHYHGWADATLISYHPGEEELRGAESPGPLPGSRGQVRNAADNFVVCEWNDSEYVGKVFDRHPGQIAAVIMEPVLCNSGCLLPSPRYLEQVRGIADDHGALLIFDEVITGFRIALGGAQEAFGVVPDLATFGKALGGGLPLSAVAGTEEVMLQIGAGVSFGGTFNGNPVSMAAAKATLELLAAKDGEALDRANRMGELLIDGIRDLGHKHRVDLQVTGFGTAFSMHFTRQPSLATYRDTLHDDSAMLRRFLRQALDRGIHILPDGRFYVSLAHTAEDIEETITALDGAFAALNSP